MRLSKSLIQAIFFGNFFYGICAVFLSMEACLQQSYPLNNLLYYLCLFAATTVYYNKAYITEAAADSSNIRSLWYARYHKRIIKIQAFLSSIIVFSAFFLARGLWLNIWMMPILQWGVLLIFPMVAAMYYGMILPRYNLRNVGWIKPFVIGFVWAGSVNIYPILFQCIKNNQQFSLHLFGILLFIKNMMFITVLCIMFDIKDYATDHNQQLKTFVVRVGLRKTIFYIMLPLCMIGFGTFMLFTVSHHFPGLWIILNAVPFVLLITVAYSMCRRKRILYYLAIIDGLMLVKAICGIFAVLLIK